MRITTTLYVCNDDCSVHITHPFSAGEQNQIKSTKKSRTEEKNYESKLKIQWTKKKSKQTQWRQWMVNDFRIWAERKKSTLCGLWWDREARYNMLTLTLPFHSKSLWKVCGCARLSHSLRLICVVVCHGMAHSTENRLNSFWHTNCLSLLYI